MKKFAISTLKFVGVAVTAAVVVVAADKTGMTDKILSMLPKKS